MKNFVQVVLIYFCFVRAEIFKLKGEIPAWLYTIV